MVEEVPNAPGLASDSPDWMLRQDELLAESDRLYDTFVKPLERDHWGEYAVVAPDGRMVIGVDEYATVEQAVAKLGPGNFVFKIGEYALATVRGRIRELDVVWPGDHTDE